MATRTIAPIRTARGVEFLIDDNELEIDQATGAMSVKLGTGLEADADGIKVSGETGGEEPDPTLITLNIGDINCDIDGICSITDIDISQLEASSGMTIQVTGTVCFPNTINAGAPQVVFKLAPPDNMHSGGSSGALLGLGASGGTNEDAFSCQAGSVSRAPDSYTKFVAKVTRGTSGGVPVNFKLFNVVATVVPATFSP